MLKFATVATVLIMVVGIVGNSLTVIALLRCPRVRNVAAAFIIRFVEQYLVLYPIVMPIVYYLLE